MREGPTPAVYGNPMNCATLGEHVRESHLARLELGTIVALVLLITLVWFPKYQVNQDLEQGLIQREDVPEQVDRYRPHVGAVRCIRPGLT